jgi:high frequency lysogenization protein
MTAIHDQTLALASMFQSASLINQLANGHSINQAAFDCSMDSLFTLNANSVEQIYGHGEGLIQGLKMLQAYFSGNEKKPDRLITYYILSMIKLERRLNKNQSLIKTIQKGVEDIEQQAQSFDMAKTGKLHKIDGLYQKTISQIKPRIIVQGEQLHLSNSDTTSRIRTLLFTGIRAAVLWRQRGGSRFKLILSRKKYVEQAEQLLQQF